MPIRPFAPCLSMVVLGLLLPTVSLAQPQSLLAPDELTKVPEPSPALLVQTSTELRRFDDQANREVLALPMRGAITAHSYQPVVVDEASGRWFVSRQAHSDATFPMPRWEIVTSESQGRGLAGDPSCGVKMTCFETPVAFTADGAAMITLSSTRVGSMVSRYELATNERRYLTAKPGALILSPKLDRAAFVSRGGITVVDWTPMGPRARGRTTKVAIPGTLQPIALTDTTLFFVREKGSAGTQDTIEALDLATRKRSTVYRPTSSYVGWDALQAPARSSVFVHDCKSNGGKNPCDLVELTAKGARVAVRGISIAYDISNDGRLVVVQRGATTNVKRATAWNDVVIIDLTTDKDVRVLPEVDVTTAQFSR